MKIERKIEKNNLKEIKRLNQRGGRMLSIIDLLNDNSLSLEMASYLLVKIQENPSFLTAALKSGTGKTTLMGALLNLLKPGIKIKSIQEIPEKTSQNIKYLVHEIGKGPYYSYIWKQAKNFFSITENSTIVSCIHANSLEEIKEKLKKLDVKEKHFENLDLILTMKFLDKRRVTEIYENNRKIKLLFKFNYEKKKFINVGNVKIEEKAKKFLKNLKKRKIAKIEDVRREFLNSSFQLKTC